MQNQTRVQNDDASELDEEEEVGKLEEMVNEMAEKVLEYRNTLQDELTNTLASLLATQRPIFLLPTRFHDPPESQHGPSSPLNNHPDLARPVESGNDPCLARDSQVDAEKLQLLKQKISSNASAIPVVLKRMKECKARMDKLESYDGVIHPAFKRRRPS